MLMAATATSSATCHRRRLPRDAGVTEHGVRGLTWSGGGRMPEPMHARALSAGGLARSGQGAQDILPTWRGPSMDLNPHARLPR